MTRYSRSLATLAAALLLPLGVLAADAVKPASKPESKPAAAAAAKAAKDERQCSMPSSPRLQKKNDDCSQATENTRWHSQQDLNSTGKLDTAEALKDLNPSVR